MINKATMSAYARLRQQLATLPVGKRNVADILDILFPDEQIYFPSQSTSLKPDMLVFRARPHASDVRFTHEHEISFRRDTEAVGMGRANLAKQPVFYGAVRSVEVPHPWFLACNEVCYKPYPMCQTFTASAWRVTKELPLINLTTHAEQASGMASARMAYHGVQEMLNKVPASHREHTSAMMTCLGEEFSRIVEQSADYWISAAFAHFIYCNLAGGISYPSVANNFKGFNVAIRPDLVEEHLELIGGQLVQYQSDGDQTRVLNYELFEGRTEPFHWRAMEPHYAQYRSRMDHSYPHV
jgi:hypothetical protein